MDSLQESSVAQVVAATKPSSGSPGVYGPYIATLPHARNVMKTETSVFLDIVRFCAALVVAFDHIADYTNGLLWKFGAFGPQAVVVFFVLSGYVIAYAVANRESDLTHYAISRFARLYSVVLPTLIIGFVLGVVGTALRPVVDWGDTSLVSYLRCLLFTNELWFSRITPGYNGPFWSLGYEVWYYLIFAAAYFAKGVWRIALTLLCVAVAGPRIMMMFPLWLMGAAAWTLSTRISIRKSRAGLLWCGTLTLLGVLVVWQLARLRISGGQPFPVEEAAPWRSPANWHAYLADYGLGLLVALNFLSLNLSATYWARLARAVERPMRWLAGTTFTLYLLHVPVAQFLAAMSPRQVGTLPEQILVVAGTFGVVFLVAEYTERRKTAWRKAVGCLLTWKELKLST
ncbi:acyltransferase family protein [Dyella sp. Tek66A03]|uniref:acyltransferase family protein n=1 Tax=Dyella sp. Tek66A03 TaxID=3458298 RepID=UPI00403E9B5B